MPSSKNVRGPGSDGDRVEFVAAALLTTALLGAGVARWTRLHPLLVGVVAGIPAGLLGFVIAAGAMSPAAIGFGAIVWLIAAATGAFGAFVGWLRRKNMERMQ